MRDEPEGNWGAGLSWSFGGLVAVYFGFPAVWVWPISKVYGGAWPDWFFVVLWPVTKMKEATPWYQSWVEWGLVLFGVS
jgi:hypothetical protein